LDRFRKSVTTVKSADTKMFKSANFRTVNRGVRVKGGGVMHWGKA